MKQETINNTKLPGERPPLWTLKTREKPIGDRVSAPDPAEGAYNAHPDTLAGGEAGLPSPKNTTLALGTAGLGLGPFWPKFPSPR